MSEEQGSFKITDRRKFNPDGSLREDYVSAETETPSAAPDKAETPPRTEPTAASESALPAAAAATKLDADAAEDAPTNTTQTPDDMSAYDEPAALDDEAAYMDADALGADDPASFINFMMSIASNAAAALGMMEHPVTGQRAVDLQLAKHWIDVLGMLQEKTKGNLSPQEDQVFIGLLSDLRMQYVALTQRAAAAARDPRGFTANDILGGKR